MVRLRRTAGMLAWAAPSPWRIRLRAVNGKPGFLDQIVEAVRLKSAPNECARRAVIASNRISYRAYRVIASVRAGVRNNADRS